MGYSIEVNAKNIKTLAEELKKQREKILNQDKIILQITTRIKYFESVFKYEYFNWCNGAIMAISIDWDTRVIFVPKNDLTLIQSTPTEIRELDLNWFRHQLKDIEDSEEGMVNPDTHRHNTEVSISGLTLARVIEIINGYTVTFENGQYAVNLIGANSNIGDVVNVNQVSVRSNNSAGMTSSPLIEYASFNNGVTIDNVTGVSGTVFPIGTPLKPVNNLNDAVLIAQYRGFKNLYIKNNITIGNNHNLENYILKGDNAIQSAINLEDSANLWNTEIKEATINGFLDGNTIVRHCIINGITYFNGILFESALTSVPVKLSGTITAMLLDCYSAVPGGNSRPVIDFDNQPTNLLVRGWKGGLKIINKTTTNGEVSIDISSGVLYIDNSCTAGEITVRGTGVLVDNSGANCIVKSEGLINPYTIEETKKYLANKAIISSDDRTVTIYDDDGVTPIKIFDISIDKRQRIPR